MRHYIFSAVVIVILLSILYGAGLFEAEPQGQPSPHALDQSE
jgi:hypothetical protein